MSDDDYRRDLVDNDGFPLPPVLTTDAAQRRVQIRELLSEVYLPEGVDIWLSATHKSRATTGPCAERSDRGRKVEPRSRRG